MTKNIILGAALIAVAVVMFLAGLAGLGMGWGDTTIVVGSNVVGNSGSLINGIGITNNVLTIAGTTNVITFAGTNTAPNSGTIVKWISVQVTGETNVYRIGLAQ